MKLNGWYRLWVVISVLLAIGIGFRGYSKQVAPRDIPHDEAFLKDVNPSLLVGCENLPFELCWKKAKGTFEMPNGHVLLLSQDSDSKETRAALTSYVNAVQEKVDRANSGLLKDSILLWVVFSVSMLLIGLAGRWVLNGFRE